MRRLQIISILSLGAAGMLAAQDATATASPTPTLTGTSGTASATPVKFDKIAVNVVGKVRNPGRFQMEERSGLLGALAAAGWLAEMADLKHIKVIRKDPSPEVLDVDLSIIKSGKQSDVILRPEDTILVEERLVNF